MKERSQSYAAKAVYYRKNYTENGKSKSKWVKIDGLQLYPARSSLKVDEIVLDKELYEHNDGINFPGKIVFSRK